MNHGTFRLELVKNVAVDMLNLDRPAVQYERLRVNNVGYNRRFFRFSVTTLVRSLDHWITIY